MNHLELLVIQPDPLVPLGRLSDWLEHDGVDIKVVRPFQGDQIPQRLNSAGLIVLGGTMHADSDEAYPWLEDIRALYRQADQANIPALGICLGAQLLATTFGGEVSVHDPAGPEYGVVEVCWTKEAEFDELVGGLSAPLLGGAFHSDGISKLPSGSVKLGTGKNYPNQVFRRGAAVGIQFHPEVSPRQFRHWLEASLGVNLETDESFTETLDEFTRLDSSVAAHQKSLVHRFLESVRLASRFQTQLQ